MQAISFVFQLVGSLGLLLYGMKLLSDGIQKSAGEGLHKILGMMTGNRVLSVLTGIFITMIIQSSGATTVMVVSFVNAGLLTLKQSVGIIFGANIGTTITAWIVSLFGFQFNIAAFAVPVFGAGFILQSIKRFGKKPLGEAIMGFGLLFLALDMLSSIMPELSPDDVGFLSALSGSGALSVAAGIFAGLLITMLIHSSSAATAIILTMSYNRLLSWEFAAAMVLGSNIGSTIDAVIASIGTRVNARRAAFVHVFFNVAGTALAVIFFKPLLALVDIIVPGEVLMSITSHLAMLHTVFNVINTLIFLPFVDQIAAISEKLIRPKENETPDTYRLEFLPTNRKENAAAALMRAEKEIADMFSVATGMFERIRMCLSGAEPSLIEREMQALADAESYADQMQEELSKYLSQCTKLPITERQQRNISQMLRIVNETESMTDDCYSMAFILQKINQKKMRFSKQDMAQLDSFVDLVAQFVKFVQENMSKHSMSAERLSEARILENQIDLFRKNLKKAARKRLEKGADVKAELLYIDLVRNLEKIGDRASAFRRRYIRRISYQLTVISLQLTDAWGKARSDEF